MIDLQPDDRMQHDPGRNSVAVKVSSRLTTRLVSTRYASTLPMIGLTEFPKSGGTWVGQVLSTYLGIPLPQRPRLPVLMRAVWHGHWTPPKRAHVLVVEIHRDCYVSLFHHRITMAGSATGRELRSDRHRKLSELFPSAVDVGRPQPGDIDRYVDCLLDGNVLGEPDWTAFHRAWLAAGTPEVITYASARVDPHAAFGRLIERLFGSVDDGRLGVALQRYDFAMVGGGADGFVRRGRAEDGWRSEISEALWPRFEQAFPSDLIDALTKAAS